MSRVLNRRTLPWIVAVPLVLLSVAIGLTGKPTSKATGPAAPTSPTAICNQSILNSPYSYNGPAGKFAPNNIPGLPTFGIRGTDFPAQNKLIVIPAGNNKTAALA